MIKYCLITVAMLLSCGVLSANELIRLQLKSQHSFAFAGYYAAQQLGYYRDAGLNVELLPGDDTTNVYSDVATGKADYGIGTSSLLIERSRGRVFKILAVIFQHSPEVFISQGYISGFESWPQKRVMLDASSNELILYLEREGVKLYDLNFLRHSHDYQDLISGHTDIISADSTKMPFFLDQHNFAYNIYSPRNTGIDFSGDNLFTTAEEVTYNPERVAAFREASLRGWEYALKYPDIVIQWIMTIYASDYSRAFLEFEYEKVKSLIQPNIIQIGHMNEARWADVKGAYKKLGHIAQDYDLKEVLYKVEPKRNWQSLFLAGSIVLGIMIILSGMMLFVIRTNRRLDVALKESDQARQEVARQANQDPLTELSNRRCFKERLQAYASLAEKEQKPFALFYLDLDRFKDINDLHGHQWGDHLLRDVAHRLKNTIPEGAELARIGGDEFTLIVPNYSGRCALGSIAQDLLDALTLPYVFNQDEVFVSASIGITVAPEDGCTPSALLQYADEAMYAAKDAGRNRYYFFSFELHEKSIARQVLISDMRHAASQNDFFIEYQPIVDLTSGLIVKFEALVRWNHPSRGLVSPDQFIPLAEESGMISYIGNYVFKESLRQLVHWRKSLQSDLMMSINISPYQLSAPDEHISDWFDFIRELGVPGAAVSLEITENMLMHHTDVVSEQLLSFRDEGINVALDDFGTGYSALAYLNRLDIDYIKIDRSFVKDLERDHLEKDLCEAIISMAHKLGLKVIAEGIETQEQADILHQFGCDLGQGYLFAKPLSAKDAECLLIEQKQKLMANQIK